MQTQINQCGLNFSNLKKITTFEKLRSAIDKEFLLLSEATIEREILYRSRGQNFKLKVNNDEISIYKFDDEGRVIPVPFDAKQKIKTVKGRVRQLILNTKVEKDWGQFFEQRENGVQIEYSTRNSKISQLRINMSKTKQSLDCKLKNESEVCYCLK